MKPNVWEGKWFNSPSLWYVYIIRFKRREAGGWVFEVVDSESKGSTYYQSESYFADLSDLRPYQPAKRQKHQVVKAVFK
jgi:hypothetical protein